MRVNVNHNCNRNIKYSFIIPHKNCPDLLRRCLGSIPQRDDIQIIIVDDNSDFSSKPEVNRKNTEIIRLSACESLGAGKARNIGLKKAVGQYVLFADADDYYTEGFLAVLDKYLYQDADVIYFSADIVDIDSQILTNTKFDQYYSTITAQSATDDVKFHINVPWNKMVNRNFLNRYGIQFEEVIQGNDILFTYQVGYLSEHAIALKDKLYCYCINCNSLSTSNWNSEKISCYIKGLYKMNNFYNFINHADWAINIIDNVWKQMKARKRVFLLFLIKYIEIKHKRELFESYYVDMVLDKKCKYDKEKDTVCLQ